MRLHRLTVQAFGPFGDLATIDFDELNDAGLFLLTGATGAGKSSLLDAVCFALYGTVPGARGVKALKSQHAGPSVAPEVVLDFSVRDRRFVVRRSPEWSRPKKRGDGEVIEKAKASITETTSGEHFLSSRAAEVGLLVTDLMGMHASQFMQVVLLPQGEFQTFLRASSQERHDVLEQLFRTDRFSRIEDWVHEHSRRLRDRAHDGEAVVRRLLDTVSDRSAEPLPEAFAGPELPRAAADGAVTAWVTARTEAARVGLEAARTADDAARHALGVARARHQEALRRADDQRRVDGARQALAALESTEADAAAARTALDDDRSATVLRPVLRLLDEAAVRFERAAREHADDLAVLAATGGPESESLSLAEETEQVRVRIARLRALVPRAAAARSARVEAARLRTRLATAEETHAAETERAERLPTLIAELTARVDDLAARAARREALTLSLDAARSRHAAARTLADLNRRLGAIEEAQRGARESWLDARERAQDLAAGRLAGMAAELAGTLEPDGPCPVCGSAAHPAPAQAESGAVTESDEAEAAAALDARRAELDEATAMLESARHRREGLLEVTAGADVDSAQADVRVLEAELDDASAAGPERDEASSRRDALLLDKDAVAQRQAEAGSLVAALRQAVEGQEETARVADAEVAAEVADAAGDPAGRTLEDLVQELEHRERRLAAALRSADARDSARTRHAELDVEARELVAATGLASLDEARSALLPDGERGRLEHQLEQRAAAAAAARAVLRETQASTDGAASSEPVLDLDDAQALVRDAETCAAGCSRDRVLAEERVRAVTRAASALDETMVSWAPVRDDSLRAESMARLVRGTGADNHLQMRLSAYVLATRLDQVVEAANERLGHMRDQRYLLQRTGRVARKGSQAGLGLEVVDQWTGDVRDPATLSGGETFVVSLSLALGLSDVVTQEAGGTEIETLFVDEGFGTLDADTLDDVMDRLDGLRSGGRTVGVVSHVTELRTRIPTQVHVEKGRTGSTVGTATLVG